MARRPLLTDDEILARARSVFVERGFAARTRQISAAVGLTWGAIALRFGSKQALFDRAMTTPVHEPEDLARGRVGGEDLRCLLERLRTRLWERWPLRLQLRLAGTAAIDDGERKGAVHQLAAALEVHARRGSIRSDLNPEASARAVLALLTGDVAQRFVARERTSAADPAFIDDVICLLSTR
jgi:AcrR family transcriptional regulator